MKKNVFFDILQIVIIALIPYFSVIKNFFYLQNNPMYESNISLFLVSFLIKTVIFITAYYGIYRIDNMSQRKLIGLYITLLILYLFIIDGFIVILTFYLLGSASSIIHYAGTAVYFIVFAYLIIKCFKLNKISVLFLLPLLAFSINNIVRYSFFR